MAVEFLCTHSLCVHAAERAEHFGRTKIMIMHSLRQTLKEYLFKYDNEAHIRRTKTKYERLRCHRMFMNQIRNRSVIGGVGDKRVYIVHFTFMSILLIIS